ncbi:peptidylprolyl isomerase [Polynucleobacter sp. MWH-Loch1C5]|uniref:FKBP-type peptidyl-prolyl cis-trans isomerase n=1 Tax=Polynucleobacter sp. MWH-Loch1C5 TaxID=2689108 RepID=UPI001C0D371E|nr:peptidylprolyl isomerase [Polynucleobacter sp. MWH-Loch1C5]MBU3543071.1 peptidylprolyl isomerase [Polynucleobacter sp. MWH-Loch1C5]
MKVEKNTIVSIRYRLTDAQGNLIEESTDPMVYLHGGYDGTFPKIEAAVDGQNIGYETTISLEPTDAFGEYDPELLKIEPRSRFPEPLEVGMQFEGLLEDPEEEEDEDTQLIYTVTDLAEDKVVLDGNHPLAGISLRFWLQIEDVRQATDEELVDGHPKNAFGLRVLEGEEGGDADDDGDVYPSTSERRPTLH